MREIRGALRVTALMAALMVANPAAMAAEAAPKPQIWGVWMGLLGVGDGVDPRFRPTPNTPTPEFTPWGAAESKRLASPVTPGECDIWSTPMFMAGTGLFPLQILDGQNQVVMLFEPTMQPRRIYTDGRGHPADLDPTWLGHSVGRWEGDVLVVDTVGSNGRARPLNGYVSGAVTSRTEAAPRLPASDQLHVTERIRLVGDGEYLEDELTVEDPKTYVRPFTSKRYWRRRPDIDMQEYVCDDNQRPHDEGQRER